MSEVTKQDITEVHKRIDKLVEVTTEVRITMAEVVVELKNQPEPLELPTRPCHFFEDHEKEHKETVKTWKHHTIKTCFEFLKLAIVAGVTYFFATQNKK